jgi:hypothetical protein
MRLYSFNDKGEPIREPDPIRWAEWMAYMGKQRVVGHDLIEDITVSTVFLGLDHNFTHRGGPVLWETMTFAPGGGPLDHLQYRCSGSREQAEAMHANAVQMVKDALAQNKSHE